MERAAEPHELVALLVFSQGLNGVESPGGGGRLFVSLCVTCQVTGLLIMVRKLDFKACYSETLLVSSLIPPNPALPELQLQRDEL